MKIKGLKDLPKEDHIVAKRSITGEQVTITAVPNHHRFITESSRVILDYTSLANIEDLIGMDGGPVIGAVMTAAF